MVGQRAEKLLKTSTNTWIAKADNPDTHENLLHVQRAIIKHESRQYLQETDPQVRQQQRKKHLETLGEQKNMWKRGLTNIFPQRSALAIGTSVRASQRSKKNHKKAKVDQETRQKSKTRKKWVEGSF